MPAVNDSVRVRAWPDIFYSVTLAFVPLTLHLYTFIFKSSDPLGYDTGFYRRYLIEPFVSFPNAGVPGLGSDAFFPRAVLDILRLTHLPPSIILYGSYLALFSILPVLLFFLLKPHLGSRGAFFAALFVGLSPVQYNSYWYMLWKNAWALVVLAGAFICIDRRYFTILFAFDIVIALSHKTTAILYITTLGVLFLLDRTRRTQALFHILITLAFLVSMSFHALGVALRIPPAAIFLDWPSYLNLSMPFLILISFNIKSLRDTPLPRIVIAFAIAAFCFPIFHLPFFERIFIFCDIALAILAGNALHHALTHFDLEAAFFRSAVSMIGICVAFGFLAGSLVEQVKTLTPLLPRGATASLEKIAERIPTDSTLLTTSDEAPWYEGWTLAHIAAPGMLRDNHDLDTWMAFWTSTSTNDRIAFLGEFDHPLYISTLGEMSDILGSSPIPCLTALMPNLYRDDCVRNK